MRMTSHDKRMMPSRDGVVNARIACGTLRTIVKLIEEVEMDGHG